MSAEDDSQAMSCDESFGGSVMRELGALEVVGALFQPPESGKAS